MSMLRFSNCAKAVAVAAILAAAGGGCRSSSAASRGRHVEQVAIDRRDSLVRMVVAAIDSPEIVVVRLDSPRAIVRLTARNAILSDSLGAATAWETRSSASTEEWREAKSAPAMPSTPWATIVAVALAAAACGLAVKLFTK